MKQRGIVKIDDEEITVKELTVKELLFIASKLGWISVSEEFDIPEGKDLDILDLLILLSSDIKKSSLILLAPSELEKIGRSFLDVNKATLAMTKYLGFDKALETIKDDMVKGLISDVSKVSAISKGISDTNRRDAAKGVETYKTLTTSKDEK